MNKTEVMIELAYMYGLHDKGEEETEEFDTFMKTLEEHANNIIEVWFVADENTSPLQLVHDYFNKEILGK